jgi:hypothetical protein
MAKIKKTSAELKDMIFERIGMKVTIRPHASRGWTATPFVSTSYSTAEQHELDRLLTGLRAVYDLKSETSAQIATRPVDENPANHHRVIACRPLNRVH